MHKVSKGQFEDGSDYYLIFCKACQCDHVLDKRWTFNGDFDKPTFRASILVKTRRPKGYCNENPAPLGYNGEYEYTICHSFVTDGKIEYLFDCTHKFAGQTLELEDI